MAIRFRSKFSKYGRVTIGFEGVSASLSGSYTARPAIAGPLWAQIGQLTASLRGVFQTTSEYTGTISSTLSGVTASWRGAASFGDNPAYWSDQYAGGSGVFEIAEGSTSFSYSFIATDIDGGDEIVFTIGDYDTTKLVVTEGPVIGNQRTLTISNAPGAVYIADESHGVVLDLQAPGRDLVSVTVEANSETCWTIGQAFAEQDAIASLTASGVSAFQVDILNRWPNNSIKFAMISGRSNPGVVTIKTSNVAPAGVAVEPITLADVGATSVTIDGETITLGSAVGGADLTDYIGQSAVRPANPGRFRDRIIGHVMRESHYYAPVTSKAGLAVIWHVRKYQNGQVEIETIVENGFFKITAVSQSYTASVTVGDSQRAWHDNLVSRPITHEAYTRWSRVDWVGSDPGLTILHGQAYAAYLTATRLVPNYGWQVPTSEVAFTHTEGTGTGNIRSLDSISLLEANAPTPLDRGLFRYAQNLGGETLNDQIGLLMHGDAVFCRTGDLRAYRAVLHSGRCCNFLPTWRRDERTLSLPRADDSSRITVDYDNAEREHQPSTGYLAYLLTGRQSFLEACQNTALWNFFRSPTVAPWPYTTNSLGRYGAKGLVTSGEMTTRAIGWSLRSLATAACISPDGSGHRTDLVGFCNENVDYFWYLQANSPMSNNLGIVWGMGTDNLASNRDPAQTEELFMTIDLWQHAFLTSSLGFMRDLKVVETAYSATLQTLHEFATGAHVGPMGDAFDSSGFSWRRASVYRCLSGYPTGFALGTGRIPDEFFPSWRAIYEKTLTYCGAVDEPDGSPTTQSAFKTPRVAGTFTYGFETPAVELTSVPNDVTSLPAYALTRNTIAPLSLGADHGVSGAAEAYAKLVGSPPYATDTVARQLLADFPRYMVTPR